MSDQRPPHTRTFHLEHADCLAARQRVVGLRVVERHLGQIEIDAATPHQLDRAVEDGELVSPRKSNFTRPAGSTHFILNWVTGISDLGSR